MFDQEIVLEKITKNLKKAKIDAPKAQAIATEIMCATEDMYSSTHLNEKLERVSAYLDSKVYKVKAQLLKWMIGTSLIQFMFNYALSIWGLS